MIYIYKMLAEQGKQYLINQKIYTKYFGFPYLELPSNSSVKSIIENMESMQNNVNNESYKTPELSSCEKLFQKTLCKYNQTYKQLNEERIMKMETLKKGESYLGKVISENDGNYYYVNNYGFTHKYSADAWENNNSNCPQTAISGDSSYLREGPDMNSGQPCKIAGKNIKNEDTGELAWVDIKGYKHVYSDSVWNKKSSTCNIDAITFSSSDYNLIPEGSPMTCTTICDTFDINPHLWERLQKLNRKLIHLAKKMSKEIQKLKIEDELLKDMLTKQQKELDVYVVKLTDEQDNMKFEKRTMENVSGEQENSSLIMTSNKSIFFILIFIAILLIVYTLKIVSSNDISLKNIIIIIVISIVILYFFGNRINFM